MPVSRAVLSLSHKDKNIFNRRGNHSRIKERDSSLEFDHRYLVYIRVRLSKISPLVVHL